MFTSRLTRFAAVSAAAVLMSACGGGGSSSAPAGQQPAQGQAQSSGQSAAAPTGQADQSGQKVHLVYFNARGAEVAERKLVDRYVKDHPAVEIEYLSATSMAGPSDTDAIANLIFNIQAKKVVDVAKIEVSRTPLDLMAADVS